MSNIKKCKCILPNIEIDTHHQKGKERLAGHPRQVCLQLQQPLLTSRVFPALHPLADTGLALALALLGDLLSGCTLPTRPRQRNKQQGSSAK